MDAATAGYIHAQKRSHKDTITAHTVRHKIPTMVDSNDEKKHRKFQENCLRLQQNDPERRFMKGPEVDDNRLSQNYMLLGKSLMGNTSVVVLTLTLPIEEEQAAHALAAGISQSNLRGICFIMKRPSRLYAWVDGELWRVLLESIQTLPDMRSIMFLNVSPNVFEDCSDLISNSRSLESMTLARGGKQHREASCCLFLSQILTRTSERASLKRLSLDDFQVSCSEISLLAYGLRSNATVTTLELNKCAIDDRSLLLFLELWLPSSPIRDLSLTQNFIGPSGAQQLLRAVANHPSMEVLNLWHNSMIGFEGKRLIGEELRTQSNLASIDVSECVYWYEETELSPTRASVEQETSIRRAVQALLEGVKWNHKIKTVTLRTGYESPPTFPALEEEHELAFYVKTNKLGRYLLSSEHELASSVWCHIFAKCKGEGLRFEASLIYFFLCAQPTLGQPTFQRRRLVA